VGLHGCLPIRHRLPPDLARSRCRFVPFVTVLVLDATPTEHSLSFEPLADTDLSVLSTILSLAVALALIELAGVHVAVGILQPTVPVRHAISSELPAVPVR
jgi:hypothetical protein